MTDLVLLIAWHVVLGIALALAVWGIGLGALRIARISGEPLLAYGVGLALALLAALLFLARWWLFPLSLLLVLPPLVELGRGGLPGRELATRLARSLPGAAGLAAVLGLLLHGPTRTLQSHAYGDLTFFATRQVSAAHSVLPFRDYLAEGLHTTYVESAPALLGGALSRGLPVDPFLFQTSSLPAFAFVALAIGFSLGGLRSPVAGGSFVLLLVAAVIYPTWLVESPPVALALPLGFSLYALWRDRLGLWPLAGITAALAWDLVLTKGLALAVLGLVVALAFVRHHGRLLRGRSALVAAAVGVAAVATAIVFLQATAGWLISLLEPKLLPRTAYEGIRAQFTVRSVQQLAPALELAGETFLLVAVVRARLMLPLAATVLAIGATWFVGGHVQDITLSLAIVLTVVALVDDAEAARRARPWLTAAALALAAMAWVRDPASLRPAFVALTFACAASVGALGAGRSAAFTVGAACVVGVALAGARGLTDARTTLTPDDRAIWQTVRERVPPTALVFTSLTGPRISGEEGWNYYPGVARRQVYLAGWANSPLRVDPASLRERLANNRAVLGGSLAAVRLELSRRYSAFYAVVRRREPAPPSSRLVYENERYALYRLQ